MSEGGFCRTCGKPVFAEAEICPNCGSRLKDPPAPAKKPKSKGKIIGIIVGVIALILSLSVLMGSSKTAYVNAVKNGNLHSYPNMTIGAAFDKFFGSPKWRGYDADNGKKVAEFTGKFMHMGKQADFLVQYTVENDGSFEASYSSIDGKTITKELYALIMAKVFQ